MYIRRELRAYGVVPGNFEAESKHRNTEPWMFATERGGDATTSDRGIKLSNLSKRDLASSIRKETPFLTIGSEVYFVTSWLWLLLTQQSMRRSDL